MVIMGNDIGRFYSWRLHLAISFSWAANGLRYDPQTSVSRVNRVT